VCDSGGRDSRDRAAGAEHDRFAHADRTRCAAPLPRDARRRGGLHPHARWPVRIRRQGSHRHDSPPHAHGAPSRQPCRLRSRSRRSRGHRRPGRRRKRFSGSHRAHSRAGRRVCQSTRPISSAGRCACAPVYHPHCRTVPDGPAARVAGQPVARAGASPPSARGRSEAHAMRERRHLTGLRTTADPDTPLLHVPRPHRTDGRAR